MSMLRNKTAIITGGSRGIGRAIAERFAREGALVVVTYKTNDEAASEVVRAIEQEGGAAFSARLDLSRADAVDMFFQEIDTELESRTGRSRFDLLVNNAAYGPFASIADTSDQDIDQVLFANIRGPFLMIKKALPRLNDGGRILNLSSAVTRMAYPGAIAYSMTKGAINTLTLALAPDVGRRGITVNALAPGLTATDAVATLLPDDAAISSAAADFALGRVGRPDDIARVAAFLASPEGGWITGQYIEASGGMRL